MRLRFLFSYCLPPLSHKASCCAALGSCIFYFNSKGDRLDCSVASRMGFKWEGRASICHIFILFFGLENTKTWKGGTAALTRQMAETGRGLSNGWGGRQNDSALTRFLCIRYLHTISHTIPEVTHSHVMLIECITRDDDAHFAARRFVTLGCILKDGRCQQNHATLSVGISASRNYTW